jgi:hypothetical protein
MKGLVRLGIAGGIVAIALLFGAVPALATNVQCGDVITQDTKLDGDLDCTGPGFALIVRPNVTLDLKGYVIRVLGPDPDGVGVTVGDHATLTDGQIEGTATYDEFGHRFLSCFSGVEGGGDGLTVKRLRIENCGNGIFLNPGRGIRVTENQVLNFTNSSEELVNNTGILVGFNCGECPPPPSATDTLVSRNFVFNSTPALPFGEPIRFHGDGIVVASGGGDVVERNVTNGNGTGINVAGFNATVERNFVTRSDFTGIGVFRDGSHIVRNTVVDDRGPAAGNTGIFDECNSGATGLVERNSASGFKNDGIEMPGYSNCIVTKNRADDNGNYGIEAVAGVVDGGGNKARGNGNPAQCLNVFCK